MSTVANSPDLPCSCQQSAHLLTHSPDAPFCLLHRFPREGEMLAFDSNTRLNFAFAACGNSVHRHRFTSTTKQSLALAEYDHIALPSLQRTWQCRFGPSTQLSAISSTASADGCVLWWLSSVSFAVALNACGLVNRTFTLSPSSMS